MARVEPIPDIQVASMNILKMFGCKNPLNTYLKITDREEGYQLRRNEFVTLRQGVAYHLRLLGYTLPEIAGVLDSPSHSSCMHKIKCYEKKVRHGEAKELTSAELGVVHEPFGQNGFPRDPQRPRIDQLCLEALAEMGVSMPFTTLKILRKKQNSRSGGGRSISKIRRRLAARLAAEHPEYANTDIAKSVGYTEHSMVSYAKKVCGEEHGSGKVMDSAGLKL